jgi:hypothetical protein
MELLDCHVKDWIRISKGFGYKMCEYKRTVLSSDGKILVLYSSVEQCIKQIIERPRQFPHEADFALRNVERYLHAKDEDIAPDYIRLLNHPNSISYND